MSYKVGDTVIINRTDGSTSLAQILEQPVHYVKRGTNRVSSKSDKPLGTMINDKHDDVYISTKVYKVVLLEDDLKPTDKGKIITKSDIVASITPPHVRGWKLLKMKSELPLELKHMVGDLDVRTLKLYMNKHKTDPELLENFKKKMNSIILRNYGRGSLYGFHGGAHPEWIMNAFIYNPSENKHFKLLRIDGNQVTVKMQHKSEPIHMGLDEFLTTEIPDRTVHQMRTSAMIGEIYRILPEYNEYDLDERGIYLAHLMEVFEKKPSGEPSSEFFSVPIEAVSVPASSSHASAVASSFPPTSSSHASAVASSSSSPSEWWKYRSTALKKKSVMNQILNPPKLRKVSSSHDGGSRKNTKSTRKQRMYKKSRKYKKSKKP